MMVNDDVLYYIRSNKLDSMFVYLFFFFVGKLYMHLKGLHLTT